jgi:large subunit ribosomal protein L33
MSTTRVSISLSCAVCGERNYKTTRTVRVGTKPLELKKFCKKCNAHTVHHESK